MPDLAFKRVRPIMASYLKLCDGLPLESPFYISHLQIYALVASWTTVLCSLVHYHGMISRLRNDPCQEQGLIEVFFITSICQGEESLHHFLYECFFRSKFNFSA